MMDSASLIDTQLICLGTFERCLRTATLATCPPRHILSVPADPAGISAQTLSPLIQGGTGAAHCQEFSPWHSCAGVLHSRELIRRTRDEDELGDNPAATRALASDGATQGRAATRQVIRPQK